MNTLQPKYDSAKSFYDKAKYEVRSSIDEDIVREVLLFSYNTHVLTLKEFKTGEVVIRLNNDIREDLLFSNTTLRHMKEFIRQNTQMMIINKAMLQKMVLETRV